MDSKSDAGLCGNIREPHSRAGAEVLGGSGAMSCTSLPIISIAPTLVLTCAYFATAHVSRPANAQGRAGSALATLLVAGPYVSVNGRQTVNGTPIFSGDTILTGPASSARLEFYVGGSVQLDENTGPQVYQRSDPGFWQDLLVS